MKFDRIGHAGDRRYRPRRRSSRIGPSRDHPRWLPAILLGSAAFYLILFWLILD